MVSKTKQQEAWARLNRKVDIVEHQASITAATLISLGIKTPEDASNLEAEQVIKIARELLISMSKDIQTMQGLIAKQDRVMAAIPPCPAHGYLCVDNALDWIKAHKIENEEERIEKIKKTLVEVGLMDQEIVDKSSTIDLLEDVLEGLLDAISTLAEQPH